MADIITVDDPDDPRLRDYTGLTDVELRRRREPAEGLFIAEGEKVIRRAKHAGYEMRSMLLSAKWVDVMRDVIDEVPAPVYAVDPGLAERVTGYHVHRGALASMQRKPLPEAGELLASARRVVVMEAVNDHTNIGAIFRSAAALGMDAVLLSPDCADPLYRRSVKVSMGAVFSVPYARLEQWPRSLETVREAGFKLLALTPDEKATAIDEAAPHRLERAALMLGAEGDGLSRQALVAADEWVRIPMAHGVDSLNVGAAAAVAFYAVATGRPGPRETARSA
ncbi:TrmH family RNA methyltransferase [Streptomyces sclerotialus]|uniref:TrmH family RNA methyltransferase n=1 Tax=Streptomyces sclerotialus TaxID=1957 RepID=UPI0004C49D30